MEHGRHIGFPLRAYVGIVRTGLGALLLLLLACAAQAQPAPTKALRVGVYQVAPYGGRRDDGVFVGASVDLWRRVAEHLNWPYELIAVSQMSELLSGLESGTYDVAIGAITITPERLARVEFSYPSHRSGVAAVFAKRSGAAIAVHDYGEALGELGTLILIVVIFLAVIGVLMWWFEGPHLRKTGKSATESAVTSWHDGLYWAVVTMTTVGYGDKTPKSYVGRTLAVVWMLTSLVLVSLLTSSIVAHMTASRVESVAPTRMSDLTGKRLAAVADSSGAEFLDAERLAYEKFADLAQALTSLAAGKTDAVVNSVGALQHLVNTRFSDSIELPRGVLAPAYMAFALPMNSALEKPLDRALTIVTRSAEWRAVEDTHFGK